LLATICLTAGCGPDSGDEQCTDCAETVEPGDTRGQVPDVVETGDVVQPDTGPGGETYRPEDARKEDKPKPRGDNEFTEECVSDWDCKSGLCWATSDSNGCTVECSSHADCQQYGLFCVPLKEEVTGCAPEPPAQTQCTGHQDCVYPTICIEQFNWCALPECTWDGDCPAGENCEPAVRKCQPTVCASTFECRNPAEFCLDGTCSPPECTKREDCPEGDICSYAQGICTNGTPCNEEGACNFYNQICIDGLCEPLLCATPCADESYICNEATGKCGPPCSSDSQCPSGMGCDETAGACYENHPPIAHPRVDVGGQLKTAANLQSGTTAQLDGTLSFDPEGFPVTHSWMLLAKPPGSPENTGTNFCQQDKCSFGPLSPGLYHVGLWVKDELGATSLQGVVAVYVQ